MPVYEFGPFRVDTDDHRLLRNGAAVPLSPKLFETLVLLLENPGKLVGKDQFMERLWPGTFVSEDTLAQKVSLLRKALAEGDGSQAYIETVPKLGYRFAHAVERTSREAEAPGNREPPAKSAGASIQHTARRNSMLVFAAVAGFVVLCVTSATWLVSRRIPGAYAANYRIAKIDVANPVLFGVISPDGARIAYVSWEPGRESIWIRRIADSGRGTTLLPLTPATIWGLTFSTDNEYVYYVLGDYATNVGCLYRIKSSGGSPEKLIAGVNAAAEFEPNGKRLVYARIPNPTEDNVSELMVANADGSDARVVARSAAAFPFRGYYWSTRGVIDYGAGELGPRGMDWYVGEIPAQGGPEKKIFGPQGTRILGIRDLDSSRIAALAADPQSGLAQLWIFNRNGDARRITNDTSTYRVLSVSQKQRMLASRLETRDSLWTVEVPQTADSNLQEAQMQRLELPEASYDDAVWTPNGDVVYGALSSGGNKNLWWLSASGKGPKQLTSNGADAREQQVAADGKFIAYVANFNGSQNIWRIDADGSNDRQLTTGGQDVYPAITPDSKWVVYRSLTDGQWDIWKVPSGGGDRIKIAHSTETTPELSPDGALIAYQHTAARDRKITWAVSALQDGALRAEIELPGDARDIAWSQDSKSLVYLRGNGAEQLVWNQPISGGAPIQLMNLGTTFVEHMDWSKDRKKIVLTRREYVTDLVLLDEIR